MPEDSSSYESEESERRNLPSDWRSIGRSSCDFRVDARPDDRCRSHVSAESWRRALRVGHRVTDRSDARLLYARHDVADLPFDQSFRGPFVRRERPDLKRDEIRVGRDEPKRIAFRERPAEYAQIHDDAAMIGVAKIEYESLRCVSMLRRWHEFDDAVEKRRNAFARLA